MNIPNITFEFEDYDEAHKAMEEFDRRFVTTMKPEFSIQHVWVSKDDNGELEYQIYLKLIK